MTQPEPTVTVTLELSQRTADLLSVLTIGQYAPEDLNGVLMKLIDHAQQGVYRPGAWERGWLQQAFGDEWEAGLEPDIQDTAADGRVIFDRPVSPCPNIPPCEHTRGQHEQDASGWFCLAGDCSCGDLDAGDPE
jgi:hypothetical protein